MAEGHAVGGRALRRGSLSNRALLMMAILLIVAISVGLALSLTLLRILFLLAGIALFIAIYRNLYLGLALALIFNLVLPQAGFGIDLGIQISQTGETRGLHFNVHEIILTMVLVSWLVQIFLRKGSWKERSPMVIPIILYILTTFLAWCTGLIHGGNIFIMIFRFIRTAFFAYIFFLFINNVTGRERLKQLVIIVMICATAVALFGLVQKVMGQGWAEMVKAKYLKKLGVPGEVNYVAGEGTGQAYRINSTFLHPNVLGGYLALITPFFISLLWYYRRWWMRALLLGGLAINLGALFFTGSRAAWIGLGVVMLIYGVFGFWDRRMILTGMVILLVIAAVIMAVAPPEFVKLRFTGQSAKVATEARVRQYKMAMDTFMVHPFFGLGSGMEGTDINDNGIRWMWVAVENAFLTYLVSHGLIGLTAFLLIFIVYFGMLFFAMAGSKDDPFIRYHSEAFLLGMLGGFFIPNFFGAWMLFAIPMVTMMWFFMGMGGSLYNLFNKTRSESYAKSTII